MKMLIRYRLLMAMLLATGIVVAFMLLIVNWSIRRGFLGYVNTMEQQRLERLTGELVTAFEPEGNWDFLRHDTKLWASFLVKTLPTYRMTPDRQEHIEKMLEGYDFTAEGPSSSPGSAYPFETRVILLDEDRHVVAGPEMPDTRPILHTIVSHGKVVGYLGLLPNKRLTETLHLRFVEQQRVALTLISVIMLLISAAISLPLSSYLVKPIKTMTAAIHSLASGAFETRVTVRPSDELGQLARDINSLAMALEKNEQLRRQWVADVSHELRTPLSVLRGEIEAIQDGIHQATPEAIRSLHGEILRLNRLVDDLYQLSLSDSGALICRREVLDMGEALSQVVALYHPRFSANEIGLALAIPPDEVHVYADPERLHQLFANLLDNSLKYTDSGGTLEIDLQRRDGTAVLSFQDSLPGVPEEELPRLFERFYRVEGSRSRSSGGAGLGLAICKNIVTALEGTIVALPSPIGGVRIVLELPLMEDQT